MSLTFTTPNGTTLFYIIDINIDNEVLDGEYKVGLEHLAHVIVDRCLQNIYIDVAVCLVRLLNLHPERHVQFHQDQQHWPKKQDQQERQFIQFLIFDTNIARY